MINKLIYDHNKSINYVAKWMKIPLKIFIKYLKQYLEWINARFSNFNIKINNRIERLKNIKGLIQIYLGLNRGK